MGKQVAFLLVCVILWVQCDGENFDRYTWINLKKELTTTMVGCKSSQNTFKILDCLKMFWFKKIDYILSLNEIPLMKGVMLVRPHNDFETDLRKKHHESFKQRYINPSESLTKWPQCFFERISKLLSTHVLQIDISEWTESETVATFNSARHRRHRNNMMAVMILGVTVLGSIIVPLGFQFLAVLGGKALLLAKMALFLASINGLKKIATSGVHYGLYQVPEHNYYDRGEVHHPRSA